jgi:hypothetical protein
VRALTSAPGPVALHRPLAHTVGRVQLVYPRLSIDLERDSFVVWVRWVSSEQPPSPAEPPSQGVRVELLLNRNSVLGPTIVYRRDLAAPVFLRANHLRVAEVAARAARGPARLDVQLVIHGSIAHAPYAALYLVRDERAASRSAPPSCRARRCCRSSPRPRPTAGTSPARPTCA